MYGDFDDLAKLLVILWIFVIIGIINYLIKAFPLYKLAKNSNQKWCWWSFIPVLQNAKLYRLAGFTEKLFFVVTLISIVALRLQVPF